VSGEPLTTADKLLRCRSCHGRTSLAAGTLFDGTRKPLRIWFMAKWLVTSQKNGVSALGLQRVLGFGSCETALRRLLAPFPSGDRLLTVDGHGCASCAAPWCGLVAMRSAGQSRSMKPLSAENKSGREIEHKAIVAIAAEEKGRGIGRIRLCRIEVVSAASLIPFDGNAVTPGETIHTDGWRGYAGLEGAGYRHKISVMSAATDLGPEVMPRVHKVPLC
jgi:hypothetical protein